MNMNQTPQGERVHIAFFGKTNVGKSSLINKIVNQDISIVSEVLPLIQYKKLWKFMV